ncbi:MAG: tetratricopeptide repeat protein [Nitrososphaerota archaeon]|nr:tetratricopeptide repeat protein [Nitrososphaerota archaeon]
MSHVVCVLQEVSENADRAFRQGDYQGAVDFYNEALRLCSLLSGDVVFDRIRFEAIVYADLSAAFGRQGKHMESFAAANKALAFFDASDETALSDVETGKYLMVQVNQGVALAALGCFSAALDALYRAKDIFRRKGLNPDKNKQWLELVERNIVAINGQIEQQQ